MKQIQLVKIGLMLIGLLAFAGVHADSRDKWGFCGHNTSCTGGSYGAACKDGNHVNCGLADTNGTTFQARVRSTYDSWGSCGQCVWLSSSGGCTNVNSGTIGGCASCFSDADYSTNISMYAGASGGTIACQVAYHAERDGSSSNWNEYIKVDQVLTINNPGPTEDIDNKDQLPVSKAYQVYASAKSTDGQISLLNANNAFEWTILTPLICEIDSTDINSATISNITSGFCTLQVSVPGDSNIKGPYTKQTTWEVINTRVPILEIVTPVGQGLTPSFVFTTSHDGYVTIGGDCADGKSDNAYFGQDNEYRLPLLNIGQTYSNCTLSVTNAELLTGTIDIPPFTVTENVEGPGGVGGTDGNSSATLWLEGSNITGGGAGWLDASGNDHDFSGGIAPSTTTLNGFTIANYTSNDKYLTGSANLNVQTMITVYKDTNIAANSVPLSSTTEYPYHSDLTTIHHGTYTHASVQAGGNFVNGVDVGTGTTQPKPATYQIHSRVATGVVMTGTTPVLGNDRACCGGTRGITGGIAEMIVFNGAINDAQRIIIENYLSAKFNIALTANQKYTYGGASAWKYDVAGVGRAADSSTHISARGSMVQVTGPNLTTDDTFLMWGHDNGALSFQNTEVPAGQSLRLTREWRIANTGVGGAGGTSAANVAIHISELPGFAEMCFNANNIQLLTDADGDFSSGSSATAGTYKPLEGMVYFTNVTLPNSHFLTIGIGGVGEDVFVTRDGAGVEDGSDWDNACTLEGAISSPRIKDDTIKMKEGVYKPTETMYIKAGITLEGGYEGASVLETSDPVNFPTVISGDVYNDDDLFGSVVLYHRDINGSNLGRLFNITNVPGSDSVTLRNFTVTGMSQGPQDVGVSGNGSHASVVWQQNSTVNYSNMDILGNRARELGGALMVYAGSGTSVANITDSRFEGNVGEHGGAVVGHGVVTVNVDNTEFVNNYAMVLNDRHSDLSAFGGAIDLNAGATLVVTDSTFTGNDATDVGGHGGAISLTMNSATSPAANKASATISSSTFTSNSSSSGGGAIFAGTGFDSLTINNSDFISNKAEGVGSGYVGNGGAINLQGSPTNGEGVVNINDTEFESNEGAELGGAIFAAGLYPGISGTASNQDYYLTVNLNRSTFESNRADYGAGYFAWQFLTGVNNQNNIINSTFYDNVISGYGGAIGARSGADIRVAHSTFYKNSAGTGGGIQILDAASNLVVDNSVFIDNLATSGGANIYTNDGASITVTGYNMIGYNGASGWYHTAADNQPPSGNSFISPATAINQIINLPLDYNGGNGKTKTFSLSSNSGNGSSAFNVVPIASCLSEDQREEPREIVGLFTKCDVGAYETSKVDTDSDGFIDAIDNCPTASNVNQNDVDGDSLGDVCDPDIDDDGVLNADDFYPFISLAGRLDTDGDGIPDECDVTCQGEGMVADLDLDGDTVPNDTDNCYYTANPSQTDTDLDGLGDECDPDRDDDGIDDLADNCVSISNPLQTDSNGNGLGDVCDVLFVKPTATGIGDCSSWANACAGGSGTQLQDVIDLAFDTTASHIFLAEGIYRPSAPVNLKRGAYIYGGFVGVDEYNYYESDPDVNLTIITGDTDANDVVDTNGVVQSYANQSGTNLTTLLNAGALGEAALGTSNDAAVVLSGIIMTGASDSALTIEDSRMRLSNMTFVGNKGLEGGAIRIVNNGRFYDSDSSYSGNFASNAAGNGGGVIRASGSGSQVTFVRGSFQNNSSSANGGAFSINDARITLVDSLLLDNQAAGSGGAIFADDFLVATMTGSTFSGNRALSTASNTGGGAIRLEGSHGTVMMSTNQFIENTSARDGGALMVFANGVTTKTVTITDTIFKSNRTTGGNWYTGGAITLAGASGNTTVAVSRSSFVSNSSRYAGAIQVWGSTSNLLEVDSSTFYDNTSSDGYGGAIGISSSADATISHATFYNNRTSGGNGGGVRVDTAGSVFDLKNSLLIGNSGANGDNLSTASGSYTDSGYNLIGYNGVSGINANMAPIAGTSFVATASAIDEVIVTALTDYAGLYPSIALTATSEAIDKIPNEETTPGTGCVTEAGYDERNFERPDRIDPTDPDQAGDIRDCDIGAFEFTNAYRVDCYPEDGLRPDDEGISLNYCPDGTDLAPAEITQSLVGAVNYWLLLMMVALGLARVGLKCRFFKV